MNSGLFSYTDVCYIASISSTVRSVRLARSSEAGGFYLEDLVLWYEGNMSIIHVFAKKKLVYVGAVCIVHVFAKN